MTAAAAVAEIERIHGLADIAFAKNPGGTIEPAVIEQMRRILPEPSAGQQAA